MRSFSNIMPNFADKLHLLVDSIALAELTCTRKNKRKNVFFFCYTLVFS